MKCPHCLNGFHDNRELVAIGEDCDSKWTLAKRLCPECKRFVLSMVHQFNRYGTGPAFAYHQSREFLCYPKGINRVPLPPEVPTKYADDYKEACLTLPDSAKASAALSRRCLQSILRDETKVKSGNLNDEIQQVLDQGHLPSHILDSLDAIRNIGNFAAHPIKSKSTGEIIEVEPGEAEWNLDVLEALFDYYFVQPLLIQKKKAALNIKLKAAGKPEMK
jgi:hypothetical protein